MVGRGQDDDRPAQVDRHREGKPFAPDPTTRDILDDAAREAHALLVARYEASFSSPYHEGGHGSMPGSRAARRAATFFSKPGVYPVDDQGFVFS